MYCNCLLTTSALRKKVWFLFLKSFLSSTQSPCQNLNFSILAGRLGTRLSFFFIYDLSLLTICICTIFIGDTMSYFLRFFYGLLRPFNVITLLVFQSSLTLITMVVSQSSLFFHGNVIDERTQFSRLAL